MNVNRCPFFASLEGTRNTSTTSESGYTTTRQSAPNLRATGFKAGKSKYVSGVRRCPLFASLRGGERQNPLPLGRPVFLCPLRASLCQSAPQRVRMYRRGVQSSAKPTPTRCPPLPTQRPPRQQCQTPSVKGSKQLCPPAHRAHQLSFYSKKKHNLSCLARKKRNGGHSGQQGHY